MNTLTKVAWALGLVGVSLFVVLTGRTNVQNFERVQQSLEDIYADRLVVKGLIFELSTLLHRKEIATLTADAAFYANLDPSVNDQIEERLVEFRATTLTPMEEQTLERFAATVEDLKADEAALDLAAAVELSPEESARLAGHMASLKEDLKALSMIQLTEGRRKLSVGDRAVDDMNSIARIENYMLAALAVMLLALIFVAPKPRAD
jgi:hypothetical protein